ncbi:ATP-binding protein [Streptomyces sp. NPDC006552]|uniref:sensor histidine kinase n=1 Tax=Streptomyces sp. NPDC006552 TaxID=3157179 RepID=UPI0033B27600
MTYTHPEATASGAAALLAREVHDRIGTSLAVALRRLELLEVTASGLEPESRRRLDEVREALADTVFAARTLTTRLRATPCAPPLGRAVRDFLHSMEPLTPEVRFYLDGDDTRLAPHVSDEILVIVREALRNVLTHSGASTVTVHIAVGPHDVHASVTDNGSGFDPRAGSGSSNGLTGMAERARALGGVTTITSAPARGTRITLWIPTKEGTVRHG